MRYKSARSLYNAVYRKYRDNRRKASNDVTELPTVLNLLGDLKNKTILDMGCGLGKHAKEFIRRGGIVTAYDASEKMVRIAKKYCKNEGTFFRGEHERVSFEPSSFDICNASLSLNYSNKLGVVFRKVYTWLKSKGVFTFSLPHPVWLLRHVENMDYSKPHKIWIKMNSYGIEIFNYYHPLDMLIQLINKNNFKLLNLIETTVSRRYKGWPEEKYRLPNTIVFRLRKFD
jgi:SAM-dependent methyltransferase